jgi:hypothetical protein
VEGEGEGEGEGKVKGKGRGERERGEGRGERREKRGSREVFTASSLKFWATFLNPGIPAKGPAFVASFKGQRGKAKGKGKEEQGRKQKEEEEEGGERRETYLPVWRSLHRIVPQILGHLSQPRNRRQGTRISGILQGLAGLTDVLAVPVDHRPVLSLVDVVPGGRDRVVEALKGSVDGFHLVGVLVEFFDEFD